jgi:predicted nuclease with TOPRIM domain
VESISSELSSKIEKDQKDKNLFVKEINNKQIEVNNLNEKVKYHRSEIATLKIYLEEKDSVIKELEEKLAQVDMKKKKIESY